MEKLISINKIDNKVTFEKIENGTTSATQYVCGAVITKKELNYK